MPVNRHNVGTQPRVPELDGVVVGRPYELLAVGLGPAADHHRTNGTQTSFAAFVARTWD